jgi:hypothetical protein
MTLVVVLVHRSPQDMSDVRADGHAHVEWVVGTGAARGTVRQRGLEAQAERLGAARAAIDLLDRPGDTGAVLDEHQLCGLGHRPRMAEARYPR